jgi:hypothetical protein
MLLQADEVDSIRTAEALFSLDTGEIQLVSVVVVMQYIEPGAVEPPLTAQHSSQLLVVVYEHPM